jgi:hypothetical protein
MLWFRSNYDEQNATGLNFTMVSALKKTRCDYWDAQYFAGGPGST